MSASIRKKIAVILVLLQIVLSFIILAGASQISFLFYFGLIVSLLVTFSFYYLLVIVEVKEPELQLIENNAVVDLGKEQKNSDIRDIEAEVKLLVKQYHEMSKAGKADEAILSLLAQHFNMVQGVIYNRDKNNLFQSAALYAWFRDDSPESFKEGETLPGQVAFNKKYLYLSTIPENYVSVYSGLGSASPRHLLFVPIIKGSVVHSIIEAAFFKAIDASSIEIINQWVNEISHVRKSVN